MANTLNLKVVSKSAKNSKGNYLLKFTTTKERTVTTSLGIVSMPGATYYMFLKTPNKELKAGAKVTIDLDEYEIIIRDYLIEEGENAGQTAKLKYLYPKID